MLFKQQVVGRLLIKQPWWYQVMRIERWCGDSSKEPQDAPGSLCWASELRVLPTWRWAADVGGEAWKDTQSRNSGSFNSTCILGVRCTGFSSNKQHQLTGCLDTVEEMYWLVLQQHHTTLAHRMSRNNRSFHLLERFYQTVDITLHFVAKEISA